MASKTTPWVAGVAVVAVGIAAGAWFLVVDPTLSDAASQRQAAADQRSHNIVLQAQIDKLKSEYAHLDDYKTQLAAIRTKVPTTGDLAELTREIQSAGDSSGLTITVDAPGTPIAFVAPASSASTPTPAATSTTDQTAAETADTPAAPAAQTGAVDGLFQIPLSVTSVGTYDQTVSFLDSLQQTTPRLFVVNQVNATSLKQSGASGGRPAVNAGDLETVITGYVLTLEDSSAASAPGATPTPTQIPVPGGQRNPFQPVGNS